MIFPLSNGTNFGLFTLGIPNVEIPLFIDRDIRLQKTTLEMENVLSVIHQSLVFGIKKTEDGLSQENQYRSNQCD